MPTVHCKVFDAPLGWYASADLNWRWTLEPDQKLGYSVHERETKVLLSIRNTIHFPVHATVNFATVFTHPI